MGSGTENSNLPDDGGEPVRRRSLKRLPDLASLYEAVDQMQDTGKADVPAAPRAQPQPVNAPPAQPETRAAKPRRKAPDLSFLDDIQTPPAPSLAAASHPGVPQDEDQAANRLVIDPDLKRFIYPDLWRKLNSPSPSRGILINTLEHVRSTFTLLSTFLPQNLVQEKMRRAVPGLVSGQMLSGTLLFSDVSGFTALSERLQALGPKGAEQMTSMMNRYFGQMLEILARSGGILLKFAGDAMLVYFPQQAHNEQVNWALRAGQRMLNAMSNFADIPVPGGKVSLKMKIGIGSGDYLAASVGAAQRMEYVVLGPAVAQTMTAESLTTAAGQIVVNPQTVPDLSPDFTVSEHKNGYYRASRVVDSGLDDFEIKAEVRRARGALSWDTSPHAIIAQVDVALRQIHAILPYLSPEVADRLIIHGQRSIFPSQYRPTTVLFCNFWGFEALLAGWGSEGVSRVVGLLNAYFNAMSDVVTRFGGMISRIDPYSKGTKMLILFGAPVAHEDDPQRAVSAALAMNAALETLNETWRRKLARHIPDSLSGPLIQHRIGVTTGSTFAGQVGSPVRREYTVMGDEVNLSARLMGAAEPGQILLSLGPDIQEQVAGNFTLTGLAPIKVKGKSKPIAIFQVQGPRDDLLASRARERGPLIGRAAELARAEALLKQAAAGHGALLILEGPAGIGKSHLADTLIQRAEAANLRALLHPCRSYTADMPYTCWSLLLRQIVGISATDYQAQVHHRKLHHLLKDYHLPDSLARPLAMLMGLKPPETEPGGAPQGGPADRTPLIDETGALAEQVLQGMKKRRSRLEVWDQLDSGQSSETGQVWEPVTAQLAGRERESVYGAVLSLLTALARPLPGRAPLGLIFFEDAHWMDAPSLDLLHWLETGLRDLPVLILLARRKGDEKDAPSLRAQTISLAPLAASETSALVANLLVEDLAQVIHEQTQGNPLLIEEVTRWYKRTHQISPDELRSVLQTSNFLQKLVLSRLESLPDELQEVAMAASVIGSEFRTGEVQILLPGAVDAVTLSNHLRALARAHLITLTEAGADARYAFQQSLVRDVLYNSLPFEKRRELHGRLGDYLNRPLSRRRALQAHLDAVLDAAAGPSAAINPIQAAETIAGHYEQAERWLDAARQFWQAGDQARRQKECRRASADFGRAMIALDKLPAESIPGEARQLKAQVCAAQGDLALKDGEYLSALTAYETARANPDPTPETDAALIFRLVLALPTQRRADEAESLLRGLIDQPGFVPGPNVLAALAWITRRAGREDAPQWIDRCRSRLEEAPGAEGQAIQALLADLSGSWAAALDAYQAASFPAGMVMMRIRLGQQAQEQADMAQALSQYQQASEAGRQAGENALAALACYRQAEVYWRTGQIEDARAALGRAQSTLEQAPSRVAAEGFTAIRKAYKVININKSNRWPEWLFQNLVEQYIIGLLSDPL